jgi:hypothetical protein
VTKGFRHGDSIPLIEEIVPKLGAVKNAFTVDLVRNDAEMAEKMTPEALKQIDGILFGNTTGDLPLPNREAFLKWLESGKAFIGTHSATDTFPGWPPYIQMIGGEFRTHGAQSKVTCLIEDAKHPATKMFPTREHPRKITLPKLEGTEVETNVMGELQWSNYFQVWKLKVPDAAVGWGGDKFTVTRDKDGHLLGVLVSAWDSEADAKQFVDAYLQALPVRFAGAKGDATSKDGFPRPDFGKVFVRQVGDKVYIVDGAADVSVLDRVVKEAKIEPQKKGAKIVIECYSTEEFENVVSTLLGEYQ